MSIYPVGSPKWNAMVKRTRELHAKRRELIDRVLQKHRAQQMPVPSALAVAEMKMPGARVLEGYGSVFNLPDYQGDIVAPGAYDAWLLTYDAKNAPIPLMLEHRYGDPDAVMGWAKFVTVDDHGLWARFALLAEKGEDVFGKVRMGMLDGLSIGYVVDDFRDPTWPEKEKGAKRVLTAIRVREISLVKTPANAASRVYSVKTNTAALVADVRMKLAENTAMSAADQQALRFRVNRVLHNA